MFLFILLLLLFIFGIFFIFISYHGWDKNIVPRKFIARLIRIILGYNGTRIFVGFIGFLFILFPIFIFFNKVFNVKLPAKYTSKSDLIELTSYRDTIKNESNFLIGGKTCYGTYSTMKEKLKYDPAEYIDNYYKISFKNNYLSEFPLFIMKLNNLEEIDLENNDIEQIDIEKIKTFKKLKKINLKNNPISEENLTQLKELKEIQIVR
jgi:hypothetical protein